MESVAAPGWFAVIGVFAATVLVHALLTIAVTEARRRLRSRGHEGGTAARGSGAAPS